MAEIKKELRIKKLARERKISNIVLAQTAGLKRNTSICDKMNGKYEFKVGEAFKIQAVHFPDYTIEQLFELVPVEELV